MRTKQINFASLSALLLFLASITYSSICIAADEKSFLWKLTSESGSAFILGSLHVATNDLYPLNKNIEENFEKSQVLVVEVNMNELDSAKTQQAVAQRAFYSGAETLQNHLSAENYKLVSDTLAELGVPIETMAKAKPWFVAMLITNLKLQKLGFKPMYGIDMYFLEKAKASKKQVVELETFDSQLELFEHFSPAEQELFLIYTIKDLETMETDVNGLLKAWRTGNTDEMEALLFKQLREDPKLLPVYEKLIFERNTNMTSKIEEFLKMKEKHFIIVGAGHLVGEKGIVALLKKKGYSVEQL